MIKGKSEQGVKFMVMKLSTEVEYLNPVSGEIEHVKLRGCSGYIPVFDTLEEAELSSFNGKYQIRKIRESD